MENLEENLQTNAFMLIFLNEILVIYAPFERVLFAEVKKFSNQCIIFIDRGNIKQKSIYRVFFY